MVVTEHRTHAGGLADLLLYDSLVDDGVMLLQDGALMAAWSFRGPDMASATHAEMAALSARLNSMLRLGSGWMIQCDAIRSCAPGYPKAGAFPDPVTRVIDDERRQQFMDEGAHFESEYFLTLTYLPPPEVEERAKGWLFDGRGAYSSRKTAAQHLEPRGTDVRWCEREHVRERYAGAHTHGQRHPIDDDRVASHRRAQQCGSLLARRNRRG